MKKIFFLFPMLITLLIPALAFSCPENEKLEDPASAIQILSPSFHYEKGSEKSTSLITGIGTLKNTSTACIDSIVIEAKFLNAANEVIDVITETLYGVVVNSSTEVAFKVQGVAARDEKSYSSLTMRVVSAEEKYNYKQTSKKEKYSFYKYISPVLPIFVFILFILIFSKIANGKNSYQTRVREQIEIQTKILDNQSKNIERIADALENKNS